MQVFSDEMISLYKLWRVCKRKNIKYNRMENEMKVVCTCAIIAIASILGLLINRIKEGKGIGLRAIQFAIITVVFPLLWYYNWVRIC